MFVDDGALASAVEPPVPFIPTCRDRATNCPANDQDHKDLSSLPRLSSHPPLETCRLTLPVVFDTLTRGDHMKRGLLGVLVTLGVLMTCDLFATAAEDGITVLERGPNHNVVQRVWVEADSSGALVPRTNSWTQMETGLNYFDETTKAWTESREQIEITKNGAVALQGQHRAIFSSNVNDPEGALDLEIQGRVRLRSSVLAVGYFDPISGKSTILATIRDTPGELLPPNQVIYRKAFDGMDADVLYTYRKRGVEADVVLREVPPAPETLGLDPQRTRLLVFTEFFDPPEPVKAERLLSSIEDPVQRANAAEPDWFDQELDFEVSRIGQGRAFSWSSKDVAEDLPELFAPVGKQWERTDDGRTLLVESVEYGRILDDLVASLEPALHQPETAFTTTARAGADPGNFLNRPVANAELLVRALSKIPHRPVPLMPKGSLLANSHKGKDLRRGFVVDWISVITGSSNWVFYRDETYYVTGLCYLSGTTVLEGGAVIKYAKYAGTANNLTFTGPLDCRTSTYRPAIFTADADNTVGAYVHDGPPVWNDNYGGLPVRFTSTGIPIEVHDLRVKHSAYGIVFQGTAPYQSVRHCQFVACRQQIYSANNTPVHVENVLMTDCKVSSYAFLGTATPFFAEHVTIQNCATLVSGGTLVMTNCLLASVVDVSGFSGAGNAINPGGAVFETVGAGTCYLPPASTHRDAGVAGINARLARELASLTTDAPLLITGGFTTDTVLAPRARRDAGLLDLGYHYPPIDYCVSNSHVASCTITLTNGISVATCGNAGFVLERGGKLRSDGSAIQLNRLIPYNVVQEASTTIWIPTVSNPGLIELSDNTTEQRCPIAEVSQERMAG